MAELTAVTEVAVQLTGLKNIDLFSQGIYQLRVHAQGVRSGLPAVPFTFQVSPPPTLESLPSSLINIDYLMPPLILDDRGEFCSGAFRIKYCDEEVLARYIARFRAELLLERGKATNGGTELRCEPLAISLRLYHARSTTQLDRDGDIEKQSREHFNIVAVQVRCTDTYARAWAHGWRPHALWRACTPPALPWRPRRSSCIRHSMGAPLSSPSHSTIGISASSPSSCTTRCLSLSCAPPHPPHLK